MKKRICIVFLALAVLVLSACSKDINNLTEREKRFLKDTKSSVEKFVRYTDDELDLDKMLEGNIQLSLNIYKKDDFIAIKLASWVAQGTITQEQANEYQNKFGSKLKYQMYFSLMQVGTENSMSFTVYSFETREIAKQAYDELEILRTTHGKDSSLIKNEIISVDICGDLPYDKQEVKRALTELKNAL